MPLMRGASTFVGRCAGMCFVNDHEVRTSPQKVMSPSVGLDKIHRDNNEGICVKDGLVGAKIFLQSPSGTGKDKLGIDVEFRREFALPLFRQMRRAENA